MSDLPVVGPREGYDRWAPGYDAYDNPLIALEEPVVRRLIGEVRGLAVADVGCGTGRHALRLGAEGARVTGVDFSSGMMAVLRGKRPPASLQLLVHDLNLGIPLASRAFDLVLCCLVLEHLADLPRMMGELSRICRPGGHVVVSDLHPEMTRRGLHARFREQEGGDKVQIEGVHHGVADYVMAGLSAGLTIVEVSEHVMDERIAARSSSARKYLGEPLLLALKLRA